MEETRQGENRTGSQKPSAQRTPPEARAAASGAETAPPPARKPTPPPPPPKPTEVPEAPRGGPSGSRLLIAVLAVLAAAELGGVIYFYTQFYTQSLITTTLQGKLDQSASAAKAQGDELARQADLLSNIRIEYAKADEERRELKRGLADGRKTLAEMEGRLKEAAGSAAEAKAALARQEQIAVYLRTRLKESKGTELQLMDRLEAAAKEKADLESKLAHAREGDFGVEPQAAAGGIPLKETVVTEAAGSPNEITGQVLVSHEKYNFVIVNLGSEDGIAVGDEGIIEQKGTPVGKVKVKKLYPRMCLADVATDSPETRIEKNFVVKFSRAPRGGGA